MASFLEIPVRADDVVSIRFGENNLTTRSAARRQRTLRAVARSCEWKFRLIPDTWLQRMNIGGILSGHHEEVGFDPFDWPGVAIQMPGHIEKVAAKQIQMKADLGDREIIVSNATDLLVGRFVQIDGTTRLYKIAKITPNDVQQGIRGNTTIMLAPRLRADAAQNTEFICEIKPRIQYAGDTEFDTTYNGSKLDRPIHLVEF